MKAHCAIVFLFRIKIVTPLVYVNVFCLHLFAVIIICVFMSLSSFMWSFEKLNRCMAHLFLGQLVSTFDEEFRILFAQSKPLVIENVHAPMGDYSLLQKRQYSSERTSLYREPRKPDPAHLEDWARHSYDDRMDVDWRMKPLKRMEPMQNPADIYSRFPSQQTRMDPFFDQALPG